MLFRFPSDEKTYGIDKQFLWGKSLLVTPVLEAGRDYVVGYFPEGLWYDFHTVSLTSLETLLEISYCGVSYNIHPVCLCHTQGDSLVSSGEEINLQAPKDKINLHLREGSVIPTQVTEKHIIYSYIMCNGQFIYYNVFLCLKVTYMHKF